jgi:hypothetical protein
VTPIPFTRDSARAYLRDFHRHHKGTTGYKFAVGALQGGRLVGIVIVGRPVSRVIQKAEPLTCEVTRLCTDGTKNACSYLYGVARRIAFEMGYTRVITYTLESEPGTSLKASGWSFVRKTRGGSWDTDSRPRIDKAPTVPKQLWEVVTPNYGRKA